MRKSCIPNIFTFINLSCGVLSILSVMYDRIDLSSIFILVAGLVDRYDGRVARFLNVSSDLGKELDSLADLVSFGVAPSILIYILFEFTNLGPKGSIGLILLLLFPICGAFRLARYNTCDFDGVFTGIPITIAGCLLALFALFNLKAQSPIYIAIILMLAFSYLMISNFKLKKL
ncbi:CDP-diacylglycerol--serine O-phosphatidyltransferase [Clostridium botulinum]|uniref:CDP-diacylglycerol--serine O-phosphatidyltransferase n=1 Tax=Clostridium botulinum (strain Eklund 17B / Type B) TaxID=935198 RepID=B2TPZ5_CLOBB|nr:MULTISPECIES: CDP-diacylglycerol--serine O-phosphatidyltransferase [Clostridium]ACD21716.1 CDP-diacylglycerol--serine O-phosphatidyltransferase [Clostridium botulinum B str. Eklund 17B (NRP)]AIY80836.1 CDP-diacylglycerol-serine O-phosphatidyltransferase [Clostridium botulinum 202F]KAI3347664.1 CDP-diacylglycerol--serine O-phosphatidyltransferase [Clostridium botulinum]KFX56881.1 CDP-diacylglycerol--serine O-phosphatidyltransferase [Clostridium botulinum]KFX59538.1 CDP-diacylglycerol--serine